MERYLNKTFIVVYFRMLNNTAIENKYPFNLKQGLYHVEKNRSLLTVALGLSLAAPAMADTAAMPASKGRVLLVG